MVALSYPRSRLHVFAVSLLLSFAAQAQSAQNPTPAPGPTPSSGYTLDVRTGLVIEDLSVTDKHGNPVTGLPQSAFHLWDNGVEQHIRSFSESAETTPHQAETLPADTYSNATLYRNEGATIAVLVDNYSMTIPDQMYLRLQLQRYINTMKPGTRMTIFRTGRDGSPVLIQSLTGDHALLLQAATGILPAMLRPTDSNYGNAVAHLENIAQLLRPVPGRKALLWFSGAFPLYLDPALCNVVGSMTPTVGSNKSEADCNSLNDVRKEAFRAMQQARIAVYPIDVRGVLVLPGPNKPGVATSQEPQNAPRPQTNEMTRVSGQYDVMDQLANATGGHAFYSTNGLTDAMASAVALATRAYTLSYRPEPYSEDGKWHKVRLQVDGGYTVRYRTGYYAAEPALPNRPRLSADGTPVASPVASSASTPSRNTAGAATETRPIVFRAHVQPDGKVTGKNVRFTVEYNIPPAELTFSTAPDGTHHAQVRLLAFAYDNQGDVLAHAVDVFETKFSATQMSTAARIGTPALQAVDTPKGAQFLLLAVEDLNTHHVGTLQVPLSTLRTEAAR